MRFAAFIVCAEKKRKREGGSKRERKEGRKGFSGSTCVLVAQSCPTLATPWTVAPQVPLSIEFSSKNTGVGCHSLLQRIFLTQGLKLGLPLSWQILYCLSHQVCPLTNFYIYILFFKKWSLSSQL